MTETETRLRRGLAALADEIDPTIPQAPNLDAGIEPPGSRSRRVLAVVALAGGVSLAGGVAAAASGLVPEPVASVFREITNSDSAGDVRPEDARVVATFSLDGTTYEYWVSESADGDRCEYMRFVRGGEPENGWKRCDQQVSEHHNDELALSGGSGVPDNQLEFSGRAPQEAAVVVLSFMDGSSLTAPLQDDGYFVVATNSPVLVDHADFPVVAIEARSTSGDVIARRNYSR